MPKNRAEYLVILKECKNIRHVFVDNLEGKFYNLDGIYSINVPNRQLREGGEI